MRRLPVRAIDANGTRGDTTYLRGDGVWATPSSGTGTSPGAGAGLYRASTAALAAATGVRKVVFDTLYRADAGFTVSVANSTITLPADGGGWYMLHGRVQLASWSSGTHLLRVSDGSGVSFARSDEQSPNAGISLAGIAYLPGGTVLQLDYYSGGGNTQITGNADAGFTMFRVVRL